MSDPTMGHEIEQLRRAVEALYEAFAGYRLRPHVVGCPCCVSDADNRQIHQRPLRELSGEELSKFAHKALTTWGTVDDFRHFVPRLLECASALGQPGYVDTEILLDKFADGRWRDWPEQERAAVRAFLMAQWQTTLVNSPLESGEMEEWLCAVAQAEDDLTPYLVAWAGHPALRARQHLAGLLVGQGNRIVAAMKLRNPFWERRRPQMRQVLLWLGSPAVHQLLEEAFFSQGAGPPAEQFSLALTVQEGLAAYLASHHKDTP